MWTWDNVMAGNHSIANNADVSDNALERNNALVADRTKRQSVM